MARGTKSEGGVKELVREKVHLYDFDKEVKILAKESLDVLGYKVLNNIVHAKRPLARALRKLDIRPYSPESVEEYKEQKLKEQRKKVGGRWSFGWDVHTLSAYDKPVPEFVLNKALQIKEVIPNVQFAVEELNERASDPDPFLIAFTNTERYYVEVWNEPEFENKVLNGLIPVLNIGVNIDDASDASDSEDDEDEVERPLKFKGRKNRVN